VLHSRSPHLDLARDGLLILGIVLLTGTIDVSARSLSELLGKRLARDARDELYLSLLGKSQTFHNRQRVGDIMARVANDVNRLSDLVVPGLDVVFDSTSAMILPMIFIAVLQPQLLVVPLLFAIGYLWGVRRYLRQLHPVTAAQRAEFGALNASLSESVRGIELVKATGQEEAELEKFAVRARVYRDLSVREGRIQAVYLPPLMLAVAFALAMAHALFLVSRGELSVGGLVTYFGLISAFRWPVFASTFSWDVVRQGISGAERILALLRDEANLDQNEQGYARPMRGELAFDNVSFSYEDHPALRAVSFRARPGQTVAIVGQTGAGKSTLARLVNRIYDVESGAITVDGIDVRAWNLDALRSRIATIEQDVFLFSRSIAENIEFGLGGRERDLDPAARRAAIEQAARDAQAHEFIMHMKDGYDTVIGERGVTLSGGQRQRLAIARALLTDPTILILDDSTSAIDSATEDEIQKAMRRLLSGRTTLLITHRLSQIRSADWVLVLHQGKVEDQGTHEQLLRRCGLYRRIFAHYEPAQAPEPAGAR
ncbi:MAG TPA: ABC transporter ATP-binding protein, partial [Chloroflexota bacterium]|nr:ABC transporter ATP-binding protein [Chloroflexota bacterium]